MTTELFAALFLGDDKNPAETLEVVTPLLMPGEEVFKATKGLRDGAVITNKRLIVVNRQGLMGKKVEVTSIFLKSITAFKIENSGTFDLDAELTIYGSGFGKGTMKFTKGFDVRPLGIFLAQHVG